MSCQHIGWLVLSQWVIMFRNNPWNNQSTRASGHCSPAEIKEKLSTFSQKRSAQNGHLHVSTIARASRFPHQFIVVKIKKLIIKIHRKLTQKNCRSKKGRVPRTTAAVAFSRPRRSHGDPFLKRGSQGSLNEHRCGKWMKMDEPGPFMDVLWMYYGCITLYYYEKIWWFFQAHLCLLTQEATICFPTNW